MLDIYDIQDGRDLDLRKSLVPKARNVVSTQLRSLEYLPNFGVDFAFFLESDFLFQNDSFKAHIVERLALQQINVSDVLEVMGSLSSTFEFKLDRELQTEGFIK